MAETWKTSITQIEPNHVRIRGYDVAELMGRLSFGGAVYLILRGELPDEGVARLMDAIVVSSIDHGVTPPSAMAARNASSTGAPLGGCVASGILAINRYHGGAIERCAEQLDELLALARERGAEPRDVAGEYLSRLKERGERMSGFGHRVHTSDPRTARLLSLAEGAGVCGDFVRAARAAEAALAERGKPLPMNVDGAMAAVLADLGFEPGVMNGLFMISRAPGLIAHAMEERARERPMRRIDASAHEYDGREPRSLS